MLAGRPRCGSMRHASCRAPTHHTEPKEVDTVTQTTLKRPDPRPKLSDLEAVPRKQRTVKVSSLFADTEKRFLNAAAAVFVRSGNLTFLAHPGDLVPADAVLFRDGTGQICGIPAVVGG